MWFRDDREVISVSSSVGTDLLGPAVAVDESEIMEGIGSEIVGVCSAKERLSTSFEAVVIVDTKEGATEDTTEAAEEIALEAIKSCVCLFCWS